MGILVPGIDLKEHPVETSGNERTRAAGQQLCDAMLSVTSPETQFPIFIIADYSNTCSNSDAPLSEIIIGKEQANALECILGVLQIDTLHPINFLEADATESIIRTGLQNVARLDNIRKGKLSLHISNFLESDNNIPMNLKVVAIFSLLFPVNDAYHELSKSMEMESISNPTAKCCPSLKRCLDGILQRQIPTNF